MKGLDWGVPASELPLRLVLFRIIEEAGGPIHIIEITKILEGLGVHVANHKTLLSRLSELALAHPRQLKVRRVANGVYAPISD